MLFILLLSLKIVTGFENENEVFFTKTEMDWVS